MIIKRMNEFLADAYFIVVNKKTIKQGIELLMKDKNV